MMNKNVFTPPQGKGKFRKLVRRLVFAAAVLFILAACDPPGTAGKSAPAAKRVPVGTLSFESPTVRKSKMWVVTNGNADQKYTNTLLNDGKALTADAGAVYSITEKPDEITNEITVDPSTGEVSFGRALYSKMTPDDPAQPAVGPQKITVQAALSGKTASYTFTVTDHFSPRESHGSVVLGDDIYVIGGRIRGVTPGASDALQSDEVWRSGDGGLTWDQVAQGTRFAGRIGHGLAVLDDNIYVMAGFGGGNEGDQRNDVWKSENRGESWSSTNPNVNFPMDSLFASAVLDDKILLMGGQTPLGSTKEVWESSDGASWSKVEPSPRIFTERQNMSSVVLGSGTAADPYEVYLIGGFKLGEANSDLNEVWKSGNGVLWTHVNKDAVDDAKFSARRDHSSAVVKDAAGAAAIYVIGGTPGFGRRGDVWRSDDKGATWNRVAENASFGARSGHSSVVQGDAVYVIGGSNSGGLSNDVWKSTRGGRAWVNVHKN